MQNNLLAANILFSQLDEAWPKRNTEHDYVFDNTMIFDEQLDNKKTTANKLVEELISLAKNGKDLERIKSINYNSKKASSEHKDKFWTWENNFSYKPNLIAICFSEDSSNIDEPFEVNLFNKNKSEKKDKKNIPDFPGIKSLQYKRRNSHVRVLQEQLNRKGFFVPEKEFGYYGKDTCWAVKNYYRRYLGMTSGTIIKNGKRFGPRGWERLFT
jgi:hypothetical protein